MYQHNKIYKKSMALCYLERSFSFLKPSAYILALLAISYNFCSDSSKWPEVETYLQNEVKRYNPELIWKFSLIKQPPIHIREAFEKIWGKEKVDLQFNGSGYWQADSINKTIEISPCDQEYLINNPRDNRLNSTFYHEINHIKAKDGNWGNHFTTTKIDPLKKQIRINSISPYNIPTYWSPGLLAFSSISIASSMYHLYNGYHSRALLSFSATCLGFFLKNRSITKEEHAAEDYRKKLPGELEKLEEEFYAKRRLQEQNADNNIPNRFDLLCGACLLQDQLAKEGNHQKESKKDSHPLPQKRLEIFQSRIATLRKAIIMHYASQEELNEAEKNSLNDYLKEYPKIYGTSPRKAAKVLGLDQFAYLDLTDDLEANREFIRNKSLHSY